MFAQVPDPLVLLGPPRPGQQEGGVEARGQVQPGCARGPAPAHLVELLRQAVAKGFRTGTGLKTIADFASIRDRADFRQIVAELEAKAKESAPKR